MWAKLYYKTNKKPKTVLCSVIKHSRKWREHSRSGEKHSPAARVHPTLLSCSRHFLACFITEQSTVLGFLFVNFWMKITQFIPNQSCIAFWNETRNSVVYQRRALTSWSYTVVCTESHKMFLLGITNTFWVICFETCKIHGYQKWMLRQKSHTKP